MFKKIIVFTVAALLFGGCSASQADDPGLVAKEFFVRLGQMNFDGAAELATEESKQVLTMAKAFLNMVDEKQKIEEQMKLAAANPPQVVETKIDGDTATVQLKIGDETEKVELVKVDGKWKVVFSKNN